MDVIEKLKKQIAELETLRGDKATSEKLFLDFYYAPPLEEIKNPEELVKVYKGKLTCMIKIADYYKSLMPKFELLDITDEFKSFEEVSKQMYSMIEEYKHAHRF